MSRVTRTAVAQRDIDEIWLYLAESEVELADRFLDKLDALTELLAAYPKMGSDCGNLGPGLRAVSMRRFLYVVYFRATPEGVCVVRVVHGHQDARSQFPGA